MTHDGSGRTSKAIISRVIDDDEEETNEEKAVRLESTSIKTLLRGIIWWFNSHKLNVALINRVDFQDSKVFTMIVESFHRSKKTILIKSTFFDAAKDKLRAQTSHDVSIDLPLSQDNIKELFESFDDEDLNESYCLVAYAASTLLKAKDCDVFMASALVMHAVLLKHIPLSQRRFPLVTFDWEFEEQIDEFIKNVSNVLRSVIDDARWKKLMDAEELETDTVDIIDGRLLRVITHSMCDKSIKSAVPEAARADWRTVSALVVELGGDDLSLEGSIEPTSSKTSAREGDFDEETEDLAVLPFSNAVFDQHLDCIKVKTDSSLAARLGGLRLYRETTHWHNYKKPLNPKYAPAAKVSKWRYVGILTSVVNR